MTCRYTYQGKTYEADEFRDVLRAMTPSEASKFIAGIDAIPSAPFVDKTPAWVGLALKRMIRYAAENGFEKISWTTGEQQAERYDLSKQVDSVRVLKSQPGGPYTVVAIKGGTEVFAKPVQTDAELSDLVGKDLADKIINQAPGKKVYSGLDLKVGGAGMRAFYDKIVPNVANDVLKKLGGGKVSETKFDVSGGMPLTGREPASTPDGVATVPAFDISQQLRASALRGLPLFARSPAASVGPRVTGGGPISIDTGLPKSPNDRAAANVDLFGDIATAQAIRVHGFYSLDRKRQHQVLARMVASFQNAQVAQAVIKTVPVDVMDVLMKGKGTTKGLLHDPSMLGHMLSVAPNHPIPVPTSRFIEAVAALGGVRAVAAAKQRGLAIVPIEGATAAGTLEGGHGLPPIQETMSGAPGRQPGVPTLSEEDQPLYSVAATTLPGILHNGNVPRVRSWFDKKLDVARVLLQDRFLMLKRHQEAVIAKRGPLREESDPYLSSTLYHGRAEARLKDLKAEHIDPLIDAIHSSGATIEQVEEFRYAQHAPSRNKVMAERNERFNPSSDKYGGTPGSGMTDAESTAILKAARDARLYDKLEAVGRQIDALNEAVLRGRIADGLMTEEQADEWRGMWDHYVPLRGVEGKSELPRIGRGFNIKGAESKQAYGRASKAGNLLSYVVSQAEEAIIRGEKNKVGQTFLNFVEDNPSDNWEVKNIQFKPKLDPETGEMTFERDPYYTLADNVFSVKREGKQFHVKLADEPLARAMKNLGTEETSAIVQTVGMLTRALSFLSTSANPEFLISNFARDIQEAGINLAGEKGAQMAKRVMKDVPRALRGAYQAIRKGDTQSEWAKYYHELERSGGLVGHLDSFNVEQQAKRLEGMLKDLDPSKPRRLWIALRGVGNLIQDSNQIVESGVRLSAYVNARRAGMSEAQSAGLAKNLTVNFNRRGELGPVMNSLYMFFNAGVQGTARLVQALKHRRTQQIVGGIAGLGVLMEILNQSMSGSGDDDKKYYDKIPTWVKDHNLIVMLPDGEHYVMLPLPYGYNTFHALGRNLGSLFFGATPLDATAAIVHAGLDAFNPLGGSASLLQLLSPTLLDPIVQEAENLSYFGTPIKPEQNPFGPKPESQLYWNSVNPMAKDVAAWLNEATSGSVVRPGGVDISPETIEHWTEFLAGGAGKTLMKTLNTGTRIATGQDLPLREIPFLRRLIGEPDERASAGDYREAVNEVVTARNELRYFAKAGDREKAAEVRRDYGAELRLYGLAQATDTRISALKRQARLLESRGLKADVIEQQIDTLKMRFTRRYTVATAAP